MRGSPLVVHRLPFSVPKMSKKTGSVISSIPDTAEQWMSFCISGSLPC